MNGAVVADASIGVSWVHAPQRSDSSDRLLNAIADGQPLRVPALWPVEVSNVVLALFRRGRLTEEERSQGLSRLASLPAEVDHQMATLAWISLSDVALRHGLSLYDATYLELAVRTNSRLATRDSALMSAARASGVQLWE